VRIDHGSETYMPSETFSPDDQCFLRFISDPMHAHLKGIVHRDVGLMHHDLGDPSVFSKTW